MFMLHQCEVKIPRPGSSVQIKLKHQCPKIMVKFSYWYTAECGVSQTLVCLQARTSNHFINFSSILTKIDFLCQTLKQHGAYRKLRESHWISIKTCLSIIACLVCSALQGSKANRLISSRGARGSEGPLLFQPHFPFFWFFYTVSKRRCCFSDRNSTFNSI